jgi:phytoene synthase|tara:strand:+ start:632 stop:1243 length:612 start_codon:yes stop_codon:yes gene_type:complete
MEEYEMKKIMEEYSTTFFECVQQWPDEIKSDIYKLYAYLRVVDEMVEGDMEDHGEWRLVIEQFHEVSDKYMFEGEWIQDFHQAMFTDLVKKSHTMVSMLEYCKGSSESVGCMMARILGCPPEADYYARCLGRAYQIINFVRDYDEDTEKGYHYIGKQHDIYIRLFRENLEEGMKGVDFIPEELRGPIFKANKAYVSVAESAHD